MCGVGQVAVRLRGVQMGSQQRGWLRARTGCAFKPLRMAARAWGVHVWATVGHRAHTLAPLGRADNASSSLPSQAPPPWGLREIHISSDVSVALWQFWQSTRDASSGWLAASAWPILEGVANFWLSRLAADNPGAPPGAPLHIVDVMPPDEFADQVTDDMWTNAGAVMALRIAAAAGALLGVPAAATQPWLDAAGRVSILYNASAEGPGILPGAGVHPEHSTYFNVRVWCVCVGNMCSPRFSPSCTPLPPHFPASPLPCFLLPCFPQATIKQADVVLVPLMLGFTHATVTPASRANDLVWYARVSAPDGPAMTWAMHAMGWAAISRWQEAAQNFNRSFATTQQPFYVWWETPAGDGTRNFLTGAGGFLQAALAGYSRLWINDTALTLDPALPEGASLMRLRGVAYLGARLDLAWDAAALNITRVPPPPGRPRSQRGRVRLPRYQPGRAVRWADADAAQLQVVDAAGLAHALDPGVPLVLPLKGEVAIVEVEQEGKLSSSV